MANFRLILGAKQTLKLFKMSHHKQSQASQTPNKSHSSQVELGTLIIQTRGHILVWRSFVSGIAGFSSLQVGVKIRKCFTLKDEVMQLPPPNISLNRQIMD